MENPNWDTRIDACITYKPIAHEELGIGHRGRDMPGPAGHGALDRDDRMKLDARLQARGALDAAAQHSEGAAQRPRHTIAGVDHRGFPGRDPRLGSARDIELQHVHGTLTSCRPR